jgi:hypothetical protein
MRTTNLFTHSYSATIAKPYGVAFNAACCVTTQLNQAMTRQHRFNDMRQQTELDHAGNSRRSAEHWAMRTFCSI